MTFVYYIRNSNMSPTQNPRNHQEAIENRPGDRHDSGLKTRSKKVKSKRKLTVNRKEKFFEI